MRQRPRGSPSPIETETAPSPHASFWGRPISSAGSTPTATALLAWRKLSPHGRRGIDGLRDSRYCLQRSNDHKIVPATASRRLEGTSYVAPLAPGLHAG